MMNILIIAGHGGSPYDPGACGCGEKEAVLTRELARLVQTELKQIDGVNPILYNQENDAYKVLKQGGSLPLKNINYVLEIHFNAAANDPNGNGRTTGTEVLVHTSENGVGVETAICQKICALGFTNRGVKRRSNLLVMNTVKRNGISHALIETCFIDDADDMKLYRSVKNKIAQAIAAGVAEGFGLQYRQQVNKTPPVSPVTPTLTEEQIRKIAQKAAQDVVQTTFQNIYDHANPKYISLEQIPSWWQSEVEEMMQCGAIRGDGEHAINMRHGDLQAAVIAWRAIQATGTKK